MRIAIASRTARMEWRAIRDYDNPEGREAGRHSINASGKRLRQPRGNRAPSARVHVQAIRSRVQPEASLHAAPGSPAARCCRAVLRHGQATLHPGRRRRGRGICPVARRAAALAWRAYPFRLCLPSRAESGPPVRLFRRVEASRPARYRRRAQRRNRRDSGVRLGGLPVAPATWRADSMPGAGRYRAVTAPALSIRDAPASLSRVEPSPSADTRYAGEACRWCRGCGNGGIAASGRGKPEAVSGSRRSCLSRIPVAPAKPAGGDEGSVSVRVRGESPRSRCRDMAERSAL